MHMFKIKGMQYGIKIYQVTIDLPVGTPSSPSENNWEDKHEIEIRIIRSTTFYKMI